MAASQKSKTFSLLGRRAFSLPEALIVIAVIGIMAAIGIPVISGLIPSSESAIAQRNLNLLNGAVHNFKQSYWEIPSASTDQNIFRSLQFRDPVNPLPGTPFLPATARFSASSSDQTYRASWNGTVFRLYPKGAGGSGFDLMKMSESTTPYVSTTNGPAVGPP